MKLKVWPLQQTEERKIFYRLVERSDEIILAAVDINGLILEDGCILCIQKDGTCYLIDAISEKLGLQLDSRGRIIVTEQET